MGVGAQHCPLGLHALWGLRAAGMVGGRSRGGWPATVVRGVWCQALSLPRPPVLWSRQPGLCDPCVPGAVGAGVGTQHRPHSWLWGWRKGVPGAGAFRRCEGRLWSGAPPPPTARPLGVLLGSVTHMPWAQVCGCEGPTLSPLPTCSVALCPRTTGPTHPTVAPSWWASATSGQRQELPAGNWILRSLRRGCNRFGY